MACIRGKVTSGSARTPTALVDPDARWTVSDEDHLKAG
jgi:hypothetical protein